MAELATTPILLTLRTTQWSHCSLSINHTLVSNYLFFVYKHDSTTQRHKSWNWHFLEDKTSSCYKFYFKLNFINWGMESLLTTFFYIYFWPFGFYWIWPWESAKETKKERERKTRSTRTMNEIRPLVGWSEAILSE